MKKVYSKIESINGSVITVKASGVKYGELAEIETSFGTSLAEVNKLNGDLVSCRFRRRTRYFYRRPDAFPRKRDARKLSDNLMGRIFNGSGNPRLRPRLKDNLVQIGGPSVNPSKRIMAERMIRTGFR